MATNTPPLDRTKREHVGLLGRVIWSDPDPENPAIILALTDGRVCRGNYPPAWFARGIRYRFLGRWEDHPSRGMQFKFDSVVAEQPHTKAGAVKYLTDVADNVGAKRAGLLWDRYGADCVQVLREEPGRVSEDGIMSLAAAVEASQALKAGAALEGTTIELHGLLAGRGFHGRLIKRAIEAWGARAPRVIRRNPFALLTKKMPGAGYKRCDKLWCDLGLPKAALKRQFFAAWNFLRVGGSEGHTWHLAQAVCQQVIDAIPGDTTDPIRALKLGIRAGWLRLRVDAEGRKWIAEARKAINEQSIADQIKRLSKWTGTRLWPTGLPVSARDGDGLPSTHQAERAARALAGSVGILCGGPGTGKTHTLAFILRAVLQTLSPDDVAVCSPTGKAAVRASQSLALQGVPVRATTIHRTLGISRNGHDGDGWGFIHNRENPLPFRIVVVDESSMIDSDLMASLLEACADGTHVLLIGDPHQLPPVGHGAPLRDLIAAGIPTGELTEVRRNAGQIVHACVRVKNGESFDTSAAPDLAASPPRNLVHYETANENESVELLGEILTRMRTFDPVWATQVIVGVNDRGPLSRKEINRRLHELLNPTGRKVTGNPFRVGDKIICLKNGHLQAVVPIAEELPEEMAADAGNYQVECGTRVDPDFGSVSQGEPVEVYVANGEIGRVVAIGERLMVVRIGEADGLVKVPIGQQRDADEDGEGGGGGGGEGESTKGDGCNFTLAYAVTCHKMQGSESPCTIELIDPAASRVADRTFWYTAMSRASKLCILIGPRAVLDRQRQRQALVKRKTFLQELIRESQPCS